MNGQEISFPRQFYWKFARKPVLSACNQSFLEFGFAVFEDGVVSDFDSVFVSLFAGFSLLTDVGVGIDAGVGVSFFASLL